MYQLRPAVENSDQAADRIYTYLERVPGVDQASSASDLERVAKDIQLKNVTVRNSAGKAVLDHLSVTIPAGRRIAVFGANSDAQIALAGLLPRFYDPTEGQILYDGHDIRLATLRSLRSQTLLVLQHSLLFSASVADNIACGDARFSDVEVREAAKRVGAYEFIQQLPQGFATTVGEHGVWLDDCERMLIGLARALIRNPAVLVVEEPARELPPEAARQVEQAITTNSQGRTIILLSPGLISLRAADQVFVIHDGTLHTSGSGSHADLVQHNDLYRHLLYLAFNEYRDGAKRQQAAPRAEKPFSRR